MKSVEKSGSGNVNDTLHRQTCESAMMRATSNFANWVPSSESSNCIDLTTSFYRSHTSKQ